ncbi:hypothetical protein CR513_09496, partial [Mucuna pruriens]
MEKPQRDRRERRRHKEEPRRKYEEEPHRKRRENRYEEPYHEMKRYFKSPHRDEGEVPKKAPMDALKCRIPPFARDGD